MNALKKLIVPPAEAETAPAPPHAAQAAEPQDTAALANPRQPHAARGTAASRPARASRLGRTMPRLQAARSASLKRTGRRIAQAPARVSRLGQVGGGRAVWYQHAGQTASGEKFNPNGLTAAHKSLPLGTRVRVVNKKNGRSVIVRINDRIPAKVNAAIDLSRGSARALGIAGVGSVALYKAR